MLVVFTADKALSFLAVGGIQHYLSCRYKGSRSTPIAWASPSVPGGVEYYGDFCTRGSPCSTSTKGQLYNTSGILTVHSTQLGDEDQYYYDSNTTSGEPDPGQDNIIELVVYGKKLLIFNDVTLA